MTKIYADKCSRLTAPLGRGRAVDSAGVLDRKCNIYWCSAVVLTSSKIPLLTRCPLAHSPHLHFKRVLLPFTYRPVRRQGSALEVRHNPLLRTLRVPRCPERDVPCAIDREDPRTRKGRRHPVCTTPKSVRTPRRRSRNRTSPEGRVEWG